MCLWSQRADGREGGRKGGVRKVFAHNVRKRKDVG